MGRRRKIITASDVAALANFPAQQEQAGHIAVEQRIALLKAGALPDPLNPAGLIVELDTPAKRAAFVKVFPPHTAGGGESFKELVLRVLGEPYAPRINLRPKGAALKGPGKPLDAIDAANKAAEAVVGGNNSIGVKNGMSMLMVENPCKDVDLDQDECPISNGPGGGRAKTKGCTCKPSKERPDCPVHGKGALVQVGYMPESVVAFQLSRKPEEARFQTIRLMILHQCRDHSTWDSDAMARRLSVPHEFRPRAEMEVRPEEVHRAIRSLLDDGQLMADRHKRIGLPSAARESSDRPVASS